MLDLEQCRATQAQQRIVAIHRLAKQNDGISFILKPLARNMFWLIDQAHHANRRRRVDGPGRILVVQADVAAGDRCAERLARFSQASNALF